MAKMGKPEFVWTEEIEKLLFTTIRDGATLKQACKIAGLSYETFYKRADVDKEFADRYALVCEQKWDKAADLIQEILYEPIPDDIPVKGWNAWVNWQKNKADGLKWIAERAYPKKWGKRMDVTSEGKAIEFKYPAPDVLHDKL